MPPETTGEDEEQGTPPHQARVDSIQRSIRAEPPAKRPNIFKPPPPRPEPSEAEVDHRIAEELEYAVRNIEQIGEILIGDQALLIRHGGTLQGLDLLAQNLRNLAKVVAAADKEAAVDRITLEELRRRLKRRRIEPIGG